MKDQLIFDVTSAATILDSDSVGAYLRASDGTLLSHTDVGGKKALDVYIAEGINVEVDLDFADDSVTAHQGGSWTVDVGNTVTVQSTDLDIRDLVFATDKVDVSGSEVSLDAATLAALETINAVQSGTWDIGTVTSITNDVNIADGGNSITVDASQLDIDDLNATDDAVQSWIRDGAGNSISSTSGALDVYIAGSDPLTINDAALANTSIESGVTSLTVASTAQNVIASPLSNRKYVYLYNNDNRKMFIGKSGVSAANGFPVSPGSYLELRAGAAVDIEFVSDKATHNLRYMELS